MGEESGSQSHTPPALNKFMHPRNPYRTPPSFKQLATLYPNFRQFCTYDVGGKVRLDFSQPRALAELAIALMHKDFGLTVTLPTNHLVPTIPLRLNYLLWLQDLVGLWAHRVKTHKEFDLQEALLLQQQQKQELEQQKQQTDAVEEEHKKEESKKDASHNTPQYTNPVIGLDIGSGASCVYGLLGARQCGWHMLASDTDADSLSSAASNVASNNLQHMVHVTQGSSGSLFGVLEQPGVLQFLSRVRQSCSTATDGEEPMEVDNSPPALSSSSSAVCDGSGYLLDFCMCNPPFFSSEQEADSCTKSKKLRGPPNNAYTGTLQETVVEGGELAFIAKMIEESVQYKDKIRVFSSLVGTAADVKKVKQLVAAVAPLHCTVTEFCQGRTMRWGVAWSWSSSAPLSLVLSKKQSSTAKPLVLFWPRTSCLSIYTVAAAWEAMLAWLHQLKLKPKVFKSTKYFVGASLKAYKATWQNQRQRRREEKRKNASANGVVSPPCLSPTTESESCTSPSSQPASSPLTQRGASSSSEGGDEHMNLSKRPLDTLQEEHEGANDDGSAHETPYKKPKLDDDDSSDTDEDEDDFNSAQATENDEKDASKTGHSSDVGNGITSNVKKTGKPCLVKVNIFVKLVNNQLIVEMHTLGGLLGRDGANQILTHFRNRVQKPKNIPG